MRRMMEFALHGVERVQDMSSVCEMWNEKYTFMKMQFM